MNVFETKRRNTSVSVAKDRIRTLLVSERVNCTPDTFEKICTELYKTVSKYIEVEPEKFDVKMTNSGIYIRIAGED